MHKLVSFPAAAVVLALAFASSPARADALSDAEIARITRGETVVRAFDGALEDDGAITSGVAYTLCDAPIEDVSRTLLDISTYKELLPRTESATLVEAQGQDRFVTLRQKTPLGVLSYTVRVRPDGEGGIRFWLDRSRPHPMSDAFGYVRVAPMPGGQTLVTFATRIVFGGGLVPSSLYAERVRNLVFTMPDRLRAHAEDRAHVRLARRSP